MLGISALEHERLAGHGQCQSMDERLGANVPVQWRGLELTIDRSEGEPFQEPALLWCNRVGLFCIFDFGSTDLRVVGAWGKLGNKKPSATAGLYNARS